MPYLLNTWYVAALSSEVTANAPLARTLLDEPVVLYRTAGGQAVALADRCPHRFAPLSRGRLVDGALECPYHGLRFGADGRCVFNPHGNTNGNGNGNGTASPPARAQARHYPVRERYGAVWFWPGDPERAAHTPLPAFDYLEPHENFTTERYLHTRANYQLSADNLLDLSHFQYLHPETLGSEQMASGVVRATVAGDSVSVRREMKGEYLRPMLTQSFNLLYGERADRELDVHWMPPGLLTIVVRISESGLPETAREAKSAHWLTPETAVSSHYFFAFGLPRAMGEHGAELVSRTAQSLLAPFRDEDIPMLEAQQRMMGERDFWSLRPVMLPIDAGAVHARRIMERLITHEAQGGTERVSTAEHAS
ncbi:aromatic ring-hydroxylating dioxygenase subunit alpha [Paraburkholderia phenoliruptrix]|uniref:Aromatic ring-hydroxylating dioxygenase subunit alpha n=1 Tax=Paraburkholderia phenoliruptrix TaxID=252970 RepID=A0ABV3W5W3_9BURK|nr:aromatic ring-hydroxylating dioxygenase subunit alpha [Paraburkholderia phenoliruptrix]MDR6390322.1 vanillate O-demethylase monooxygenase subunit [Paraburkholderia phenoliruptrix]